MFENEIFFFSHFEEHQEQTKLIMGWDSKMAFKSMYTTPIIKEYLHVVYYINKLKKHSILLLNTISTSPIHQYIYPK